MAKKKEASYGLNTKLFKMLSKLEKEGKIRSIPEEQLRKASKAISKELGTDGPKATLRIRTISKRNVI